MVNERLLRKRRDEEATELGMEKLVKGLKMMMMHACIGWDYHHLVYQGKAMVVVLRI